MLCTSSKLLYQSRWLFHTFFMGRANVILSCKSAMEKQTLSSLYVIQIHSITFTPGSFGVQPSCSSSSSTCAAPFVAERGSHYSLVGQSTDKIKLHRRLLCCIHDRLAFDDVAACRSCGSYWRQLTASLPAAVANACCQIHACALPLSARRGCGLSAPGPRNWLTVCHLITWI